MKEILLETRLKNNRLYKAIHKDFESVSAFCDQHNIQREPTYAFLNLRLSPYSRQRGRIGEVSQTAAKILSALGMAPDYLFPPDLYMRAMRMGSHKSWAIGKIEVTLAQAKAMALDGISAKREIGADSLAWLENNERSREVEKVLTTIPDREAEILRLRFGLTGDDPWDLERVGKKLGLSRERVRQIESKAIMKFRRLFPKSLIDENDSPGTN